MLEEHRERISEQLHGDTSLRLMSVHELLKRDGVEVAYTNAAALCAPGRVRVMSSGWKSSCTCSPLPSRSTRESSRVSPP